MKRLIIAALILILSLVFSGVILDAQNSPAAPANEPQQEVLTDNGQEDTVAPEQQNEQQQENDQQQNDQQQEEENSWFANLMNNATQTVNNLESELQKTVDEASQVVNETANSIEVVDQTATEQGEIVQDAVVENSDETPALPAFNSGFMGFLSGLTSRDCPECEGGVCSNCGGEYYYCGVCEDGYCTECGGDGKL